MNDHKEYRNHKLSETENQKIDEFQRCLPSKPVPIIRLAKEFGLEVFLAKMPVRMSGSIRKRDGVYQIHANAAESPLRQRFTYAHELAHYLLHRDDIGDGFGENMLFRSNLSNKKEVEANKIAADILMPMSVIESMMRDREIVLSDLAEVFEVSRSTIMTRLGIPAE